MLYSRWLKADQGTSMKVEVAARVAAAALCLLFSAVPAAADTMVVRGHRVESPRAFIEEGDEVYAPFLAALKYLGAEYEMSSEAIIITTGDERQIVIARERAEATRDGVLRELPGPPREERGVLVLPAKAVGSLLGCAVRWAEETRTLYVYPWVRKFSLATLRDRHRLTIGAEGPIRYETGELDNPPRLFVDLIDMDLAQIPSQVMLEGSYLKGARVHQHSLAPAPEGEITRVVVELEEWREYRVRRSEDKRTLEIEFPLPEAVELPPDVPPVILTGLEFQRISSQLAAVKLSVFGTPYCTSQRLDDAGVLCVEIANASSRIERPFLELSDAVVLEVCMVEAPEKPGTQRLMIPLREAVGHAVVTEDGKLQILLGKFALEELKVVVDAGHGGHDTGAIGRSGLQEKDVNLDIARRVYRMLQAMGVEVRMTRVDDNPLRPWTRRNHAQHRRELVARCDVANEMGADLFVSIHSNARESNPMDWRGTETYYRKADSYAFACAMQEEMVKAVRLPDGGVIRHPKSIIVLYRTQMPSVLVEVGYLSHPEDEAQLATQALRDRAARGIVNGIRRYVEEGGMLPVLARRERERLRKEGVRPAH